MAFFAPRNSRHINAAMYLDFVLSISVVTPFGLFEIKSSRLPYWISSEGDRLFRRINSFRLDSDLLGPINDCTWIRAFIDCIRISCNELNYRRMKCCLLITCSQSQFIWKPSEWHQLFIMFQQFLWSKFSNHPRNQFKKLMFSNIFHLYPFSKLFR